MFPSKTPDRNRSLLATSVRITLLASLILAAFAVVGCGGGEKAKDDVVLAKVGDKEILGSYYENRLSLLKKEELPRDDQGHAMDMATQAGKEKFLETLITKEVMAETAMAMGYNNDPQITGARESLMAYEAGLAMWANEIDEPANFISEEQLQEYYSKLGKVRTCRYVVTNFLDDAKAACEMARSGADWEDVVAQYHDGDPDPTGYYEISIPFGRYNSNFGDAVYLPAVGEVTDPVETVYGYWVLKIENEKMGKRPALEDAKAKILDAARGRIISGLQADVRQRVHDKYKFFIKEDALFRCYEGLPATEEMFYPGTKDPVKREDLKPLDIATVDHEMPFYGYTTPEGEERLYTLGDYKSHFDNMSVFQRPKKAQMLGGLRQKITEELDKPLLNFEARSLGYYDDEGVLLKVNARIEEMLVNKLYTEAVTYNKRITPAQLDSFWVAHEADYFVPETRTGRLVVCATPEMAAQAATAANEGTVWRDILVKFGTDKDNKSRSGKLDRIRQDGSGAIGEALFGLTEGQISSAFPLEDGRYGVVMLNSIIAPHQLKLNDISEDVGKRMKQIREEDAFQAILAQWKQNIEIVTYPEKLAGLKSWQELTTAPVPENLVPRNQ